MFNPVIFGENVNFYRTKNKYTQAQLANLCGVSSVFIGKIERGLSSPSIETIYSIADALNISVFQLLCNQPEADDAFTAEVKEISRKIPTEKKSEILVILESISKMCL